MGLGQSYDIFVSTYTQTHILYGEGAVTFDEVTYAAVNKELRISSSQEGGIAMFAARGKGKSKPNSQAQGDKARQEYGDCKTAGRKSKHDPKKYWHKS